MNSNTVPSDADENMQIILRLDAIFIDLGIWNISGLNIVELRTLRRILEGK